MNTSYSLFNGEMRGLTCCYGCMRWCVIHNSFATYGNVICGDVMEGVSFVLVTLTRLNMNEPNAE